MVDGEQRDGHDATPVVGRWFLEREGLVVGVVFALMAVMVVAVAVIYAVTEDDTADVVASWGFTAAFVVPIAVAAVLGFAVVAQSWAVGALLGVMFGVGFELTAVGMLDGTGLRWIGGGVLAGVVVVISAISRRA